VVSSGFRSSTLLNWLRKHNPSGPLFSSDHMIRHTQFILCSDVSFHQLS
jgi:hypothetical protein